MAQRWLRQSAPLLVLFVTLTVDAASTRNDDSCDIAVMPAATLLLPYFEVDLDDPPSEVTLFSITNAANTDAIARVTLWTDRAYPVLTFNVVLTGYDVQSINLYDVLTRGVIAPGSSPIPRGKFSDPAPLDLAACAPLPVTLDATAIARLRSAFTTGNLPGECDEVGNQHENAIGYATIDVVANCSPRTPFDAGYWTRDLRYDNVLLGDYQQISNEHDRAEGGPLVHIRAIPEGGARRSDFPRTFYARYQSPVTPQRDGRQPLPSQFAVRGGGAAASLKVWREGRTGVGATCRDLAADESLAVHEVVSFDHDGNANGSMRASLPATSRTTLGDGDWTYVNLDRSARDEFASQGWIIASMRADGAYATDFDAVALGNGCSPPAPRSEVTDAAGPPIAPAPNASHNDDSCDIALLPAATLLLPFFQVELDEPVTGNDTVFTIVNVSPRDQIARVTLWTDYAFPVFTFNIPLTGYDTQRINLSDLLAGGTLDAYLDERGPFASRNPNVDLAGCPRAPVQLSAALLARMQSAFTQGTVPDLGDLEGCNNVGNEHEHAVGYATIDLVRNCSTNDPFAEEYWTEDLAYENVLIGDSALDPAEDLAMGSPLVHIRAIPEGGTPAERRALQRKWDAGFPRTFYARYQPALAPRLDGRQPLPSVFAARWISGGVGGFRTFMRIWREGKTGPGATCGDHDQNHVKVTEIVVFDEQENAVGEVPQSRIPPFPQELTLPATSFTNVQDASVYPQTVTGALAGWMYLNLDHSEDATWASSNWVVASLRAGDRFSVDLDAAALGNGCTPDTPISEITRATGIVVGPRP